MRSQSVLLASGINEGGYREILGLQVSGSEPETSWPAYFGRLRIAELCTSSFRCPAVLALPARYRRRERVIRIFPNEDAVVGLMGALPMEQDEDWSAGRKYFNTGEHWDCKRTKEQAKPVTLVTGGDAMQGRNGPSPCGGEFTPHLRLDPPGFSIKSGMNRLL